MSESKFLKVGAVFVGGGGGQVGYTALSKTAIDVEDMHFINSSVIDLKEVSAKTEIAEDITTVIGDGKGMGKDIKKGTKVAEDAFPTKIFPKLEKFKDYDRVYVIFTTGGGTGASAGPVICTKLKEAFKTERCKVSAIMITPKSTESVTAQANSGNALNIISGLNIPYLIYDNDLVEANQIQTFQSINTAIINDFKILRGDMISYSKYGQIDEADLMKLISTPGMIKIGKITGLKVNHLDDKGIDDLIKRSLVNSLNIDTERDKVVKNVGFILNLEERVLSAFNRDYTNIESEIGKPKAIFDQLNTLKETEDGGTVITILSGLSFPISRLKDMNDEVIAFQEELKANKAKEKEDAAKRATLMSGITFFDDDDEE